MTELKRATVYQSLTQPPMLMGLPQTATLLGIGAMFLACVASGYDPVAIGAMLIAALVARPFLRRMFEKEPFMMDILPSYFNWPPFMPHHSRATSSPRPDFVQKSPYG